MDNLYFFSLFGYSGGVTEQETTIITTTTVVTETTLKSRSRLEQVPSFTKVLSLSPTPVPLSPLLLGKGIPRGFVPNDVRCHWS